MGEDTFDKILEYARLEENDREAFEDYLDLGHDYDLEKFREALLRAVFFKGRFR